MHLILQQSLPCMVNTRCLYRSLVPDTPSAEGDAHKMKKGNLTPKTITAPLAAFTMACILFAYTRSSIRSARDQAVRLPISPG
ncbi:hypothetical protein CORC01_13313 [Colletotrichum orchidophilum]|uniref:Uncharacterized protein n=1 Tax=Colletotrichum orchidophilum TaxID=1209926 RepID=A0A1G4AQL3_9PEZI|nr:uncharacterized protein CORC01_13313 [Colletotrichum orchidophilum]OHE91395.1 hypothetical protein CORC01_13313 [Colletotrichum orchidophilum]